MLATKGQSLDGKRVVVSGSGNVAIYAIEKVQQFGGKVLACSDSNGYVLDQAGIDLDLLKEIKEVRRDRLSEYARTNGAGAHYIEGGSIWYWEVDMELPFVTPNQLTGRAATPLIKNRYQNG